MTSLTEHLHSMDSFSRLPPETRNSIYGLLLTSSSPNLTLLTASRLLHKEAASYFYQNNSLTIDLMDAATTHATILSPIPNRYLRYCRALAVDIRVGYTSPSRVREQAQRLAAIADHCASLTVLTLNVTSTASGVMSSTMDDFVLHTSHPLTLALQHILSRGAARSVRVILSGVWFAPVLLEQLMSEGCLEVVTCESSVERAMYGRHTRDHMRDFGLELQEIEHAEDLQPSEYDGADETAPSSLSSGFAFSELDTFSPTEYRDTYHENLQYSANEEHPEAFSDDPMFDMDVLYEGSEEELTEDDDVDEEEMEDIDDIEGIVDNLVQVCQQRATDEDVCYMTNFAPNMLRAWSESLP